MNSPYLDIEEGVRRPAQSEALRYVSCSLRGAFSSRTTASRYALIRLEPEPGPLIPRRAFAGRRASLCASQRFEARSGSSQGPAGAGASAADGFSAFRSCSSRAKAF